jgi:hypothetical protein
LAALLIWPAFIAGLWVGLLALLFLLGAAVILAILPRSR